MRNFTQRVFGLIISLALLSGYTQADNTTFGDSLQVSYSINHPTCSYSADGFIDITVAGGISPLSFAWSNGLVSEDVSGLASGTYTVTITDNAAPAAPLLSVFSWAYTNTGNNHTIFVPSGSVSLNGVAVTDGFIGLFYDTPNGLECGGYKACIAGNNAISAWGSQPALNDGFATGETFKWKFFRPSDGTEVELTPVYQTSFANDSIYIPNGISGIISLSGTTTPPSGSLSSVLSFDIVAPSAVTINASLSDFNGYNISNNGLSDGAIQLTVNGGTAPYSYNWTNSNGNSANLSGLAAGVYDLIITDINNCTFSSYFNLTEPSAAVQALSLSYVVTDELCGGNCDGSIDITATGGSSNYSFLWSNGSTQEDLSGLCAGSYSVTVFNQSNGSVQTPFNWTYNNTGSNHVVLIQPGVVNINGTSPSIGDYIGVFYQQGNSLHCAGYNTWNGGSMAVTAWGSQSGNNDGLANGESFKWKMWSAASMQEIDLTASYEATFPNSGFYLTNGMSSISSLTGSLASVPSGANNNLSATFTVNAPNALSANLTVTSPCISGANNGAIDLEISGGLPAYNILWSNGATSEDIGSLSADTYSVQITDANGCTATASIALNQVDAISISSISSNYLGYNISQNGLNDGWIDITPTGGLPPYTFEWSTGQLAEDLNNLTAGTYEVTVTDNAGCFNTASFVLTEPASISVLTGTVTSTDPACYNACNGTLEVTLTGGVAPYTILWSNGNAGLNIDNLCAGSYTVTISDSGTGGNQAAAFNWTYNNTGTNHSLLVPASAGLINGNPLNTGDYIGVFYDVNGAPQCGGYIQWDGSTTAITAWGAQSGTNDGFALGETFQWKVWRAADSSIVNMLAVYDATFPNGNTFAPNGMSGLSALTGSVVNNNTSQTIVLSGVITDPDPIQISAIQNDPSCSNFSDGTIDIEVSNGCFPINYQWSTGFALQDLSDVAAGTYAVTVTCSNGCDASEVFTLADPNALDVSIIASDYNGYGVSAFGANDGTIDLSIAGGLAPYQYSWSNSSTSQDLNNLSAGTYEVTITDSNGCSDDESVVITQPAQPTSPLSITAAIEDLDCSNNCDAEIEISVSGGIQPYTYLWSNGNTSNEVENLCAGTYTVSVTDASTTAPVSTAFNWTYINTGINHIILVPVGGVTIDGQAIQVGDYIGVFYNQGNDLVCGGYKQWNGVTTALTSWGTQAGQNDGFVIGEEFKWKVWSDADSSITDMTATYQSGFSNTNTYLTNGMSGLLSLTGAAQPQSGGQLITETFTITAPNQMQLSATITDIDCYGANNGSIDLAITGGLAPYIISWEDNSTSEIRTGLSEGTYNVSVQDANGCQQSATYIVAESSAMNLSITTVNPSCNNLSNGQLSAIITGGASPYTFNWSSGQQSASISNIAAGEYCLTVSDNNGCQVSQCATLVQPLAIEILIWADELACNNDNSGSLTMNVSGGAGSFQYLWSNGATNAVVENLAAGTYSVTVVDQNSCTASSYATIVEPAVLASTSQLSNYNGYNVSTFNASDAWIDIEVTGGVAPYSYAWSTGSTQEDLQTLSAGTYNVIISDMNGCSISSSYTLTQPTQVINPLIANATTTAIDCSGACDGTISLAVSGGVPPYSYEWTNGAQTQNIDQLCAGQYAVTVSDSNFGTIAGQAFDWTYVNTGNNHTIALPYACVSIDGQAAQPNDVLGVFYDNAGTLACGGYFEIGTQIGAITAWGTEVGLNNGFAIGETFTWKLWRATDGAVIDLTPAYATGFFNMGTYSINGMTGISSLTGNSTASNIGDSLVLNVTISEPAVIAINNNIENISCNGSADGAISIAVSGGISPYSILWSNGSDSNTIDNLAPGTYVITVSDANSCSATEQFEITEPLAINTIASSTNVSCYGVSDGNIALSLIGGTAPYQVYWSNGANTESLNGLAAGTYEVTVHDTNNCQLTQSFIISEPTEIVATVNAQNNNCFGDTNGMIEVLTQGGVAPYSYNWSNGETTAAINNLSDDNYCVVVTDQSGCSASICEIITGASEIVINAQLTHNLCSSEPIGAIDLNVSGGNAPYAFSWTYNETTEDLNTLAAGTYTVTITDNGGCTKIESFEINSPEVMALNFTKTNVSVYGGADGAINLTVSGGSSPYSYSWSNGATSEDINALNAGVFSVTVSDSNGCTISDSRNLLEPLGTTTIETPVSCVNSCDGAIELLVGGGVTPYFYEWSNSEAGSIIDQLCAGSYSVTVSDSNFGTNEDFNWNYEVTGTNHTIAIPLGTTTIDGAPLNVGDFIGVFYHNGNDLTCGGYQVYNGITTAVTAWGAESGTDNGFVNGEAFIWQVWRSADSSIVDLTATYTSVMPNQGTYVSNGMSGISTLTGSSINSATGDSFVLNFTLNNPAPISITAATTNVSCNAGSDGAIQLSVNGGISPITYNWSNNQQSPGIENISAGEYFVTITDANGCEAIESYIIAEPSSISVTLSATDVLCANDATGSIQTQVSGGTGTYAYIWAHGAYSADLTNLEAGEYTVSVYDQNQCLAVASIIVNEPAPLSLSFVTNDPTCFGAYNGSVITTVVGGVAPFTYSWSNGSTTANLENEGMGYFCLGVDDANGCNVTDCAILFEPEPLGLELAAYEASCNGENDGGIAVSITGGTYNYSYSWSNQSTGTTLSGLVAGVYSLTVTDSNNCEISESATVYQPDALSITGQVQNITCNGGSNGEVDITVLGGTSPYTYSWSNGENTEDLTNLLPGTYQVTITDAEGCDLVSDFYTITEAQALSIQLFEQHVTCFGGSNGEISIIADGGNQPYSFSWDNGSTLNSQHNLGAGTYCVTLTDLNGCTIDACQTISEPSMITVSEQLTDVSCNGLSNGAISLNVSGGSLPFSYSWSTGSINKDLSQLSAGSYELTIIDGNACSLVETYSISTPAELSINAAINHVSCYNGNNGNITLSVAGGNAPYTYNWSNNVLAATNDNLPAGTYAITVTDANGCDETASYVIEEATAIAISLTAIDASCFGATNGSISSSITGGTSPYTYNWSNGVSAANIDNLEAGTYTLFAHDSNNCVAEQTVLINEPTEIIISATITNPVCFGENDGSLELSINGGLAPYTYNWDNSQTGNQIDNLGTGSYCVTVSDASNCTSSACFEIESPLELVAVLSKTDLTCFASNDGTMELTLSGGTANYTFAWSNGSTNSVIDNLPIGTYAVTATDANGCTITESGDVTQPDELVIDLGADATINMGEAYTFDAGTGFASYNWNTGETTQSITATEEGIYWVSVSNLNGCTAIDSVNLIVNPYLTQSIPLSASWNLVSFNVIPQNSDIAAIVDSIVPNIAIVKNGGGQMYWPFYGVNLIGNTSIGEGFAIKLTTPDTLYVEGMIVVPENNPIQLPAGNSLLGYLRQEAAPISDIVSSIISSVQIIKDESGMMFWPFFGIDLIGDMEPGEAYQVKLSNPETITYPSNSTSFAKSSPVYYETSNYKNNSNTGSNMTLGIPATAWNTQPEFGDEIAVFNNQSELLGSAVYANGNLAVTIWGDDETTNEIENLKSNEQFQIVLWHASTNSTEALTVSEWQTGSNHYNDKSIAVVAKFAETESKDSRNHLQQNYPNPFIHSSEIVLLISEDTKLELSIYNSVGEKVREVANGNYSRGKYTFVVDGSGLAKGAYYYRLTTPTQEFTKKMQKI